MRIILGLGGDSLAKNSLMTVAAPGFETMERVVSYQNIIASMIGYSSKHNNELLEEIKLKEIERLEQLKASLLAEEKKLKDTLGIISIEELNQRLQEWNNSGLDTILINGSTQFNKLVKEISKKITQEWFNKNFAEALIHDAKNGGELHEIFMRNGTEQITKDVKFFQNIKRAIKEKGYGSLDSMPNKYFTITVQGEPIEDFSKEPVVDIYFSGDISSGYAKKISNIIKKINGYEFKNFPLSDKLKAEIVNNIKSLINVNSRPGQIMMQILTFRFEMNQQFDLSKNESVIKGFLGEAYWTAFWQFITAGKVQVIPTGTSRGTSGTLTGKEIPIDIILGETGFQVKNYRIIYSHGQQLIKFPPFGSTSIRLDNFIESRLDMPAYKDAIEKFFFSYGYNRLVDNDTARKIYSGVANRFDSILYTLKANLEELTLGRLDKVIGLDRSFSFDNELVDTSELETTRYNTVWLIGNKFVFGSDIVDSLITGLWASRGFDIRLSLFDTSALHQPELGAKWPEPTSYDPSSAMKGQIIKYQIEIDISTLIRDLMSRIMS